MKPPYMSKAAFHLIKTGLIKTGLIKTCLLIWLVSLLPAALKADQPPVLLQSTTSTLNSGLYDHILPRFFEETGIEVRVVAVGSGQALRNAANCDGDAVLAHAPEDETAFMESGFGLARLPVMENRFVLLGPGADPAGIREADTAEDALRRIADAQVRFLSRGDDSGTHQRERRLWAAAGITPESLNSRWYLEAGQGMGASINLAVQLDAYLLSDISTWLAFGNQAGHKLLYARKEAALNNRYSIITLNPAHCPTVNHDGAGRFADWLTSTDGQAHIASFQLDGQQMFTPAARRPAP